MKPTVGRIVHFHMDRNNVRPAIIVNVFEGGLVNLQVFTDGSNDRRAIENLGLQSSLQGAMLWATSLPEGTSVGKWSWPPRA